MKHVLLAALVFVGMAKSAAACGVQTDCEVPGGIYRIDLPADGPTGAVIFAHGYRGTAAGTMRNRNFRRMATDMGLAFVALDAGPGDDWQLPNAPGRNRADGSRNFAYVAAVVDDLKRKYGFGNDRVMATGFSAGGMLVWNLACARPDLVGGFAPMSGTFWLTPPAQCNGPAASIIHMHGDADPVVPITGRPVADTHQGDVNASLSTYAAMGGFDEEYEREWPGLGCTGRQNAAGEILEFCKFSGGHTFRRGFVQDAWNRFVAAGQIARAN